MKLDQLLGRMTVEQLQELADLWAPDDAPSNSKRELFRSLHERMVRPDRVRHCLELADQAGRGILRKLLRSENASQSVAVLAASSTARPRSIQETRAAVADLAAMGFVFVESEKRWETYGSARVGIADELIEPLRQATGIDDRSPREILDLAAHLALLSREDRIARMDALGIACDKETPVEDLAARLAEPDACHRRIAALSPDVRNLVHGALRRHAGIADVDDLFRELGLEMPEIRERALSLWRSELEDNLIGTVGDLSLLEYGIDLDGKVLVVFREVAETLLAEPSDREVVLDDPVGPDFLLDLSELLSSVRRSGLKLKASGELTAAAADRLIERMNRPAVPGMSPRELLELRLACAERLGLVERAGKSLEVRGAAWKWEQASYEQKARDLLDLIGSAVPAPRSLHHHEGLCEIAHAVLRSMVPGTWWTGGSFVHLTVRRYLDTLDRRGLRERIRDDVRQLAEYVLPPFPGLGQLCDDVHRAVVLEACAMGVLDRAFEDREVAAERLSDFGATAVGLEPPPQAPGRLIATPDFEVILLPEGDTTRLRYEVGQFAAREKFERTYHLRITQERVEEAVVRGLTADDMLAVLHAHADVPVPQNVEYSIRGWAERVRVATIEDVHVLELPDARLLDVVAELPGMKPLVVRRISPTALALRQWPNNRRLLADLRRLGVHVR